MPIKATEKLPKLKNLSLNSKEFKKVVATAFDGICIYQDRRVVFVSDRLCKISGYAKDDIIGKHIFEFFPPSELPKIAAIVSRRESGEDLHGNNESILIDKSGGHKDVQLSSSIIMIDGKLSVISFINDISESKKAQKEIERRLDFQEKVSKLSSQFINFSSDEIDLGIQKSLKELGEFANVPRCFIVLFNDDKKHVKSIYEWYKDRGSFQHNPGKIIQLQKYKWAMNKIHADGVVKVDNIEEIPEFNSYLQHQLEIRGIRSAVMIPLTYQKKLIGIGGFCDSTPKAVWSKDSVALLKIAGEMFSSAIVRKRNEMQIAQMYETQSVLYSQVAHSLRTTFAVVLGNIEMLSRPTKQSKRSYLVKTIKDSVGHANLRLKELFEIAKLNSMPNYRGSDLVSTSDIFEDLEKQASFLFKSYYPEIEASNHIVFDHIKGAVLVADQPEILNGLLMLIDNALLHSPKPGDLPYVAVSCNHIDSSINITIEDKGKGIDRNELDKVFELFYSSDPRGSGQGIGLAHTKKIIEAHGGNIRIESILSEGTKCIVSLPIRV